MGLVRRRHPLAVLEPAGDDERRVDDRHREDEQRQQQHDRGGRLQKPLDRHRREEEAEDECARAAHEDPRREEPVAEEADAGSGDDRREDRRVRLPQREREHGEGDAGDPADAGGEAVHPVEEVDHVHDGDDPENGQRHTDRRRKVHRAEEREREVVDPDAEEKWDRRGDELPGELAPRREHAEVVDRADHGRDRRAEQHPRVSRPSSRKASAGTKIPKKSESPPSRGTGLTFNRLLSGRSTTPRSRAMPPTAGVSRITIRSATAAP